MLAGAVGGLCCVGPSAAVLLGLGSSSALAGLALDRGAALASGAALLAAGIVAALRSRRACELRGWARWRGLGLMIGTFALAYALIAVLLPTVAANRIEAEASRAAPEVASKPASSSQAAPPALRRITLSIAKMDCPPCAAHVRALLKRKPFVRKFFAEEGADQVTIDYDSRQISPENMAALIPLGYGVSVVSDIALP